jgi:hypothetical protein
MREVIGDAFSSLYFFVVYMRCLSGPNTGKDGSEEIRKITEHCSCKEVG